ncbi:hypothetical protein GJ744_001788 [Endocarpon pusillum]|uniref:Uncharacterized protein n=1 Tax=Endocarpon pusillum TaxID=364733 RepID=A0A8H7AB25_9EURO|nr:hypothetical protein GJ744_001788 [Endocarpon pusillum]
MEPRFAATPSTTKRMLSLLSSTTCILEWLDALDNQHIRSKTYIPNSGTSRSHQHLLQLSKTSTEKARYPRPARWCLKARSGHIRLAEPNALKRLTRETRSLPEHYSVGIQENEVAQVRHQVRTCQQETHSVRKLLRGEEEELNVSYQEKEQVRHTLDERQQELFVSQEGQTDFRAWLELTKERSLLQHNKNSR